jgi:hypothetical protein
MHRLLTAAVLAIVLLAAPSPAQLPPPPPLPTLVDFPFSFAPDAPGRVAADALLDKPAGRLGPIVARDGHFYTRDRRIRFWGVNLCFAANFPAHEQSDKLARRLARFGVNAVRFHHMDNQKFPGGIFADAKLEKLSDEALDRLDYLVAALKKEGIYTNLNLHVSRPWAKTHDFENADKLPESYDKLVDLFHPELIKADKQFARDLLTHVNKYTGQPYATEPAVCMVEINNENTMFFWGGEQALARLPQPYAGMLNGRWNDWLARKYATREKLAAAWNADAQPLGENLLTGNWAVEQRKPAAAMTVASHGGRHDLTITAVSGTEWHLQFNQPGLKLRKGRYYTLTLTAESPDSRTITASAAQAHAPWVNLGLAAPIKTSPTGTAVRLGFTTPADDDNARISFAVGKSTGQLTLRDIQLREGGQEGLRDTEDPFGRDAKGSAAAVASHTPGAPVTAARTADWFDFLQQLDESYFTDFRDYLKNDLKVAAPVTGTIGLGPLGTLGQSKMDFVDAHAYWDHPKFPNNDWNPRNWTIDNKPMVDDPAKARLWELAATRVAGKPFTVTEYNHAAPNDYQAEAIPIIATYAALQDWDAVFLFSYSHNSQFEKDHTRSYFDIEGNWSKMAAMPLAARLFLGGHVKPFTASEPVYTQRPALLKNASASYYDIWRFTSHHLKWQQLLGARTSLHFDQPPARREPETPDPRLTFTASGPNTGRYTLNDPHAPVFTGFNTGPFPIPLGPAKLEKLETPFASIMLIPADPTKTVAESDRLLLVATARTENTNQQWNATRTTVGTNWGKAPARIEVVKATLTLPHDYTVRPLDAAGQPINETRTANKTLTIGDMPTVWYELTR